MHAWESRSSCNMYIELAECIDLKSRVHIKKYFFVLFDLYRRCIIEYLMISSL